MSSNIKIGLGPFLTYVNSVGVDRIKVIREQRERYTNPESFAWWCYQPAFTGIRNAIASAEPEPALAAMVVKAPKNMGDHYAEIAEGARKLLKKQQFTVVPTRAATWHASGLDVRVDHCLGLRSKKGELICAFPYFKAGAVPAGVKAGAARIIEATISEVLPGATPALLHVREGKLTKVGPRDRNALDAWLQGEARGYCFHWESAA